MEIKEALAAARRDLTAGLREWTAPASKLLPADIALAYASLKCALRYQNQPLALSAGRTLAVFAPDMLWRALLGFAAADVAPLDMQPTLAVMAATGDKRWIKSKGGTTRVASYLIAMLMKAPRTMIPTYLWRLSFDPPEIAPPALRQTATDAQKIRRGILSWLGLEDQFGEQADQTMRALDPSPEGALTRAICLAAFRRSSAGPVLMVPLARTCTDNSKSPEMCGVWDSHNGSPRTTGSAQHSALYGYSYNGFDTMLAGRKSIRAIIASTPGLPLEIERLGLFEEEAIVAVDELLERQDEDASLPDRYAYRKLHEASRWSGVGVLSRDDAQRLGQLLLANASAIAAIRAEHIPPSLLRFVHPEASRSFQ